MLNIFKSPLYFDITHCLAYLPGHHQRRDFQRKIKWWLEMKSISSYTRRRIESRHMTKMAKFHFNENHVSHDSIHYILTIAPGVPRVPKYHDIWNGAITATSDGDKSIDSSSSIDEMKRHYRRGGRARRWAELGAAQMIERVEAVYDTLSRSGEPSPSPKYNLRHTSSLMMHISRHRRGKLLRHAKWWGEFEIATSASYIMRSHPRASEVLSAKRGHIHCLATSLQPLAIFLRRRE